MRSKRGYRGIWIVPLVIIADRITKVIAMALTETRVLIPGVLNARYVKNTGIAFSMFSGGGAWLCVFTAVLIAALTLWLLLRPEEPGLFRCGLWLIVGGGLGNLYDRLIYGYVIDFFETAFVRFAIFNVADACICIGAALAVLGLLAEEIRLKKNDPKGNEHAE